MKTSPLSPSFALASLLALAAGCGGATELPKTATDVAPGAPAEATGAAATAMPTMTSATEAKVKMALSDGRRPAEESARDKYRHPMETLKFLGLRDDMTVVELWPGGGWYTTVLAPVLAEKGKLHITSFDPTGPEDAYATKSAKSLKARLDKTPDLYGKVAVHVVKPPTDIDLGPAGTADMVVTFRNFHNWLEGGTHEKILAASFKALKPGGVFGVEEHRAGPGTTVEQSKKSGYVTEDVVIKACEAAGFKLVERSEINANAKDTKDHPEGVWTLPPVLKLKDKDRAKYEAIGESDRMTLKFVKPATAPR